MSSSTIRTSTPNGKRPRVESETSFSKHAAIHGTDGMGDLKNPRWIITKGFLFLGLGFLAAGLLLWEAPSAKIAGLLLICVWAFCRFYYFAFYVIEHYVDDTYRFSGLMSAARYLLRKRSDIEKR
jgi:hypothetical protein